MDVGAVEDPVAVADGEEDFARFLDAFGDLAVRSAADALRGEQPGAPDFSRLDARAGFFEPVAAEVGLGRLRVARQLAQ